MSRVFIEKQILLDLILTLKKQFEIHTFEITGETLK